MFDLDPAIPFNLMGDPLRVSQILTNYCSNAVKFTDKGEIVVSIKVDEKNNDKVKLIFEVRDTGIGLTEDEKDKLFNAFTQAETSTTRKYGGTGLGLTICKKLSLLMGGDAWLESEKGKGSSFFFTADFGIKTEDEKRDFKLGGDLNGMKVLIVDDNKTSCQILREATETFSFKTTIVNSGSEAIKEISKTTDEPYKLVLMDWKMPIMDGLETTRTIKQIENIRMPKIIMLTAFGREEVAKKAREIGINEFLVKPITYSSLFNAIMNVFGKEMKFKRDKIDNDNIYEKELLKLSGARILLTEDNEINQQVAKELLTGVGFKVEIANNGREAVGMIVESKDSTHYDMVLMDIQMPVLDGYAATKEIRKYKEFDNIPIVAMTADAMVGVKEKCITAGMQDYITKPINPSQIFKALIQWIKPRKDLGKEENNSITDNEKYQAGIALPEIDGVDTTEGIKRIGGNKKLYIKLLRKFYNTNLNFEIEIRGSVEKNETELSLRLIHTLKGVAGNLGAKELYLSAKELETDLKDNSGENFENLLSATMNSLNKILEAINSNVLNEIDKPSRIQLTKAGLIMKLKELLKLLKEYDSEAGKKFKEISYLPGFESQFEDLAKSIDEYDFDSSIQIVSKIIKESK